MLAFIPAALLALAPFASALTINTPGSWPGNSTVQVTWEYAQDDVNFSLELANDMIKSGLLAQGPYAVGNNLVPNAQSYTFELPVVPASNTYYLIAVAVDDINTVFSKTNQFAITENLESTTVLSTQISTNSGTTAKTTSHSGSTTKGVNATTTAGTSTGTGTTSVPTTTSQSSFTSLIISTVSSTSTTATTSKGAATRVEAAWYVGFVTAVLGAVFA